MQRWWMICCISLNMIVFWNRDLCLAGTEKLFNCLSWYKLVNVPRAGINRWSFLNFTFTISLNQFPANCFECNQCGASNIHILANNCAIFIQLNVCHFTHDLWYCASCNLYIAVITCLITVFSNSVVCTFWLLCIVPCKNCRHSMCHWLRVIGK